MSVSFLTLTKCPRIKYTPSWIWKEEPVAAEFDARVIASGLPAAIEVLPKSPDVITVSQVRDSPSENVWVELFAVLEFK